MKNPIIKVSKKGSLSIKGISEKVGKEISEHVLNRIFPKFNLSDVLQIIIGSSILAVPVGFTEETWRLGESLPLKNILILVILSLFFIGLFVQFNYHRNNFRKTWLIFTQRVLSTYIISFIVVGTLLTIIDKAPWQTDFLVAFKRIAIVTFPSSMSAAVADTIK